MKNLSLILFSILLISSCKQEDMFDSQGVLCLDSSYGEENIVVARSGLSDEETETLKNNSKIRIYKGGKLIQKYLSWSEMPSEIFLPEGDDYTARVSTGDSVLASFTDKTYEGNEPFVITKGSKKNVTVNSNIINTLVEVVFADGWSEKTTDLTATVSVDAEDASLEFVNGEESKTGYFICPSGKEYLKYTLSGTSVNGKTFQVEDILKDAEGNQIEINPSTLYTIKFNPKEGEAGDNNVGGGFFDLVVDETPLYKKEDVINIYRKPHMACTNNGENIDMELPWVLFSGSSISPVFTITGSTPLSAVTLGCGRFTEIGLENELDLFDENDKSALSQKGVTVEFTNGNGNLSINFGTALDALLADEGEINISFNAEDSYATIESEVGNKTMTKELNIVVNNMTVEPLKIPIYEMWAKKVKLYGQVIEGRTPGEDAGFMYRVKDIQTEWIKIQATPQEDGQYRYDLTDLSPATTYEFTMYDGDKVNETVYEFTTEEAAQLPNAGFEEWDETGTVIYPNETGASYWDSGNTGATTLGKDYNITTKDASVKHSGEYSANLASRKIITQFAAGNIFIGKYLETVMDFITGHGVLGLGRPFTSRPIALRGYVRYTCGIVDEGGDEIANDSPDQGIIYMALTDDRGTAYEYGGEKWSFIIKTKDKQFFSKDNENVIAYGEKIWTESTQGEGMHEFVIRFNYDEKTDGKTRIPTRLLLVAAASRYGDYFQGSTSSRMWLDDLELVYDESELNE